MICSKRFWSRTSTAMSFFFALLTLLSLHQPVFAQQPPERIVSPEVSADHRVTIRFRFSP